MASQGKEQNTKWLVKAKNKIQNGENYTTLLMITGATDCQ
jgi:hypothetical protein